jgi:hypothetical protein
MVIVVVVALCDNVRMCFARMGCVEGVGKGEVEEGVAAGYL